MNWQSVTFDWNQVRAFLVTAEEGSLSAASRALGLTQPTLSRQVAALEEALEVTLFERVGRGLTLTDTGHMLLDHVREMGEAAGRVSLAASGQVQAIEGRVSITATDLTSAYVLPPILRRLADIAPGITFDIVASNEIQDLQRREADIALRHARPTQPDLIAKRLRDTTANLYATDAYFERHGRPKTIEDLEQATYIGYGPADEMVPALKQTGLNLKPEQFRYSSRNGHVVWEMVRAGLGIAIMVDNMTELTGFGEVVTPAFNPIPIPLWLTVHRELHTNRRIRLVFDVLAQELGGTAS